MLKSKSSLFVMYGFGVVERELIKFCRMWEKQGRVPRDPMAWLYGVRLEVKNEDREGGAEIVPTDTVEGSS